MALGELGGELKKFSASAETIGGIGALIPFVVECCAVSLLSREVSTPQFERVIGTRALSGELEKSSGSSSMFASSFVATGGDGACACAPSALECAVSGSLDANDSGGAVGELLWRVWIRGDTGELKGEL